MTRVIVSITAEVSEGFTAEEAIAEILFDAGVGDGPDWPNNIGQSFAVTEFHGQVKND